MKYYLNGEILRGISSVIDEEGIQSLEQITIDSRGVTFVISEEDKHKFISKSLEKGLTKKEDVK